MRRLPILYVTCAAALQPGTSVGSYKSLNNFRDLASVPIPGSTTVKPAVVLRSATPARAFG